MPVHWTKSETRSCHLWKQHAADPPPPPAAIMAERECYITTGRGGESEEKTTPGLTHSLGWHKHIFTLAWQRSVQCECTKMNGKNRNWNVFFLSKANPGWKRKEKSFSRLSVNIAVGASAKLQPRLSLSLSPDVILQTIQKAFRDPLPDDACRINTQSAPDQ